LRFLKANTSLYIYISSYVPANTRFSPQHINFNLANFIIYLIFYSVSDVMISSMIYRETCVCSFKLSYWVLFYSRIVYVFNLPSLYTGIYTKLLFPFQPPFFCPHLFFRITFNQNFFFPLITSQALEHLCTL
jgi:hypothetical protein